MRRDEFTEPDDVPDPSLPLREVEIDLELDGLAPEAAVELITRTAATLVEGAVLSIDRDRWEPLVIRGRRHRSPREQRSYEAAAEATKARGLQAARTTLERLRSEFPQIFEEKR